MKNSIETKRIYELLSHFDCSAKEVDIYLQCLQIGLASIQTIADKMGDNRFTIHSAVETLVKKGLLYETKKGKRRMIGAEDPNILYGILEQRKNELDTIKVNLDYGVNLLRSMQPVHSFRPTVRFYDGAEGVKKMLEESLSAKKEMIWFSNVDLLAQICGEEYLEKYYKKRAQKGIRTRLIFPTGMRFAKKMNDKKNLYNIDYRELPERYTWESGICSWDNIIALLSYTQQHVTCTIIENDDLARFYRNVDFELSWLQAVPS